MSSTRHGTLLSNYLSENVLAVAIKNMLRLPDTVLLGALVASVAACATDPVSEYLELRNKPAYAVQNISATAPKPSKIFIGQWIRGALSVDSRVLIDASVRASYETFGLTLGTDRELTITVHSQFAQGGYMLPRLYLKRSDEVANSFEQSSEVPISRRYMKQGGWMEPSTLVTVWLPPKLKTAQYLLMLTADNRDVGSLIGGQSSVSFVPVTNTSFVPVSVRTDYAVRPYGGFALLIE